VVRSQSAVDVQIDVAANRHSIDAHIYGVAFADTASMADLHSPLNRWGGNATSSYNWQANAENRASDWYFESIGASSSTPGDDADTFVSQAKAGGADPLMTIPMVGWVAKLGSSRARLASFSIAKYGAQSGADSQFFADAGNGVSAATGQPITGNDPNDAHMPANASFQLGWMQHLVSRWGTSANGGVRYYALDNEPSIWHSTHRDVHPTGAKMDEVFNDALAYGAQIKAVDPGAIVMGPEEWGWSGYFFSGYDQQWAGTHGWNNLPDRTAHGSVDYLPWFLDQLRQRNVATGQRLLDIFSVHFYPQGGQYGNDTSTAMQLLRNRSTRALWDPNYVDESWIGTPVMLVPRLKNWVTAFYPGTKVGITEYNWGAEGHINGATTEADILGIFGREGLDLATMWTTPAASTPTYKAIKLYRNYDGQGSAFGDTSVSAIAPNPDLLSVFAAQRSAGSALTIMAVNKDFSSSPVVNFRLANFTPGGAVQVWRLTASNTIARLADATVSGSILTATLPAQSITLFAIPAASAQQAPNAPTNLRIVRNPSTGPPASVSPTAGTPQSAPINTAFVTALKAVVRDASSNPVNGATVTFAAPASGAGASFGGAPTATAVTNASGVATASTLTANSVTGGYTVAASVAGVATPATFSLTNTSGSSGGGVWTNVTPNGLDLNNSSNSNDNFGVQDVLADPVIAGVFYAFTCYNGMWRSSDYGLTWAKRSTTGGPLDFGKNWGEDIAPDGSYMLATSGNNVTGNPSYFTTVLKSTDGGVTWVANATTTDPYMVSIDPYNKTHAVGTSHNSNLLIESSDSGATWTERGAIGSAGPSAYVHFLNDSNTLLAVSQEGGNGTYRGTRSGSTWTWTHVSALEHSHGSHSIVRDLNAGAIFNPGSMTSGQIGRVEKSTDNGATWTSVTSTRATNIIGTGSALYTGYSFPAPQVTDPSLQKGVRPAGTSWSGLATPAGMSNGPKRMASAFDGTHWVIISGNWNAGIWRYIE
jgi:hypothetical protein